jgi:hypothetical protein
MFVALGRCSWYPDSCLPRRDHCGRDRIRKLPFSEQTIPTHDVTGVAEERTWSCSYRLREFPFGDFHQQNGRTHSTSAQWYVQLSPRLDMESDAAAVVRVHRRRTVFLLIAFLLLLALSVLSCQAILGTCMSIPRALGCAWMCGHLSRSLTARENNVDPMEP